MSNSKNFMSIRSKLLAAIAMLLVASFMVVSSTYAWFTLSTAPEVTGITTQIGANGNLEIALNTGVDIENSVGAANWVDKNKTWGNIISLDDASYGLGKIVMKPSTLYVTKGEDGKITINTNNPLVTPVYGSDGRIESLSANGFYGKYTAGIGFVKSDVDADNPANSGYGVRALGTVSSMTHQQLLFANSSTAVKTALSSAATLATNSLQANGKGLVNLILKGASGGTSFTTKDNEETTDVDEPNELAALDAMITALGAVPTKLGEAVENYLLLKLAFATSQLDDSNFDTLKGIFDDEWATNLAALADGATSITLTLPEGFAAITLPEDAQEAGVTISGNVITIPVGEEVEAFMEVYSEIVAAIAAARSAYTTATAGATATFDQVKAVLANLMDITTITINGKTYAQISDMKNANDNYKSLMDWGFDVMSAGVKIHMTNDSGVYADIASITKDINAGFPVDRVEVMVPGFSSPVGRDNVYVNMYTSTGSLLAPDPSNVPEPAGRAADENAVISDSYAYVLDFAFRTNAAGSNLLLQQDAKDRIYGDNGANSQTMGGGSYMSFDVLAGSGFTAANVQSLMSNIRLVFVDTDTDTVIVGAKLETGVINSEGNNVKASVVLCDVNVDEDGYLAFGTAKTDDNQVITSLTQNEEKHISVYVYFDGVTADNSAVAAIGELSASGKLNLQFASSADLKPMDYSDLKTPAETTAAPNT